MWQVGEALLEGVETRQPLHPDAALISDDLAPTPLDQRTFTRWDVAALWIGLVVRRWFPSTHKPSASPSASPALLS
jgi:cytosine/uracil/thiamine/allantoin permease